MRRLTGIVLAAILAGVMLATPVLANPPALSTVVDNLQYSPADYQYSSPKFVCGEMSFMSFRFFKKAGYEPLVVRGYDPVRHQMHCWVESSQFDSGTYYEATGKSMQPLSNLDRFTQRNTYNSESQISCIPCEPWEDWYDWKWTRGDMNDDGTVNIFDFVLFAAAYDTDIVETWT